MPAPQLFSFDAPPDPQDAAAPPTPSVPPWLSALAGNLGQGGSAASSTSNPAVPDLLRGYLSQAGGDPYRALILANVARMGNPTDPGLRDAEHALFAHHLMTSGGPFGPLMVAAMVPGYAGAKYAAQALPTGWGQAIDQRLLFPLAGATRPTWSELYWGLSPLWSMRPQ